MILAPDSSVFRNQLLHNQLTKVTLKEDIANFDFSEKDVAGKTEKDEFFVKFKSDAPLKFKSRTLKIVSSVIPGKGYLYVIKAERSASGQSGDIRIN
jgi:hypothetical protein